MDKNTIGYRGETAAVQLLSTNNYTILEQNWRYKHREIDIIAEHNNMLVFIEVKTRKSNSLMPAESSVSRKKQKDIIVAANQYILSKNIDKEARFDIICIYYNNKSQKIQHIIDAFYPIL